SAAKQRVSLLKIDVEGHEAKVVAGGRALLKRDQPLVLFEQHRHDFRDGTSPAIEALRDLSYGAFITFDPHPPFESRLLKHAARLVVGEGFQPRARVRVAPGTYPMILAVPSSLSTGLGAA